MAELHAESVAQSERHQQAGGNRNQRQKIISTASGTFHTLEKLSPIKDSDPIEEHDEFGQADRTDDLGLGRKGANRQTDEKNAADTERKSKDIDLADEITETDGEKRRKNWLAADHVASSV